MSAKEERTDRQGRQPRVVCTACDFAWYSAAMAEGVRALGVCPRCGGEPHFTEADAGSVAPDREPALATEPHLALGIPRPRPR